jgi:dTDP-4-amino-4,6-dideoxygalactose transaminase
MADMDAILALAEKHNLVVIEDCAHAHGAKWNGRGAGTIGHFGSFSLQSSKTLTAGEGGILLCRSEELARKVMAVIDCGRGHEGEGGIEGGASPMMGGNYRMTEFQAALALVGIERFPEQAREREKMAAYMDEALSEIPGVRVLPREARHTTRSFYRYIFAIDPATFGVEHDVLCAALDAEGVDCWVGYEAMHHYALFQPRNSRLASRTPSRNALISTICIFPRRSVPASTRPSGSMRPFSAQGPKEWRMPWQPSKRSRAMPVNWRKRQKNYASSTGNKPVPQGYRKAQGI